MQKVYTKSLTHWLTDEACSHKVFPNGRPKKTPQCGNTGENFVEKAS